MIKPMPKREIVVAGPFGVSLLFVTVASNDAAAWVEDELAPYGRLFREGNRFHLFVDSTYDVGEIVEYIRQYSDE